MNLLRRSLVTGACVAGAALLLFVADAAGFVRQPEVRAATVPERAAYVKHVPATMEASIRISDTDGMGSGVHIGKGFIVTAAHVVKGQTEVTIKTHVGQEAKAAVLWASSQYDVALLRTEASIPAADLDCRTAQVGSTVVAIGNPLGMDFISSYGKIAGEPREFADTWKSVFVTDLTVIMGNSGGGVFSEDGQLVGIVVGVLGVPGANESKSYLGLSTVVPSSVVCRLMGRK
jgi:S1-C subfamily serine protease